MLIKLRCFLIILITALLPSWSLAATPVVLFSDLEDAPTTGWEQSATKGAAVTIWCKNVGSTRGASYVTVGGVDLTSAADYAEWGATTTPTVPLGMQRITFYLNSSMTTTGTYPNTTIKVTTSEGSSGTIPFHTRALGTNKIYFIDIVNGDNSSNNGLYAVDSGTNGPKKTPSWARGNLLAGDIAYVLDQGTAYDSANSHDDQSGFYTYCKGGLLSFCDSLGGGGTSNHAQGTIGNSIGFIAYPGHAPKMTPLATRNGAFAFIKTFSEELEGWTFSKFDINGLRTVDTDEYGNVPPFDGHVKRLRLIGSMWTTPAVTWVDSTDYLYGDCIDLLGGKGSEYIYILGNYFYDIQTDTHHGPPGTELFESYAVYLNGYGTMDHVEIGWNEIDYTSYGRGLQIYGHLTTDWIDNIVIHDNYVHDTTHQALVFGGDGSSQYQFVKTAIVYNNIFDVTSDYMVAQFAGHNSMGRYGGDFVVYNNTFLKRITASPVLIIGSEIDSIIFKNNIIVGTPNANGYYSTHSSGEYPSASIADGSNNLYYGAGSVSIPPWDDSTLINNNPLFVDSTPETYDDYALQSGSPAIGAGVTNSYATIDFAGLTRGVVFDIGAFEYAADGGGSVLIGGKFSNGIISTAGMR